MIPILRILTLKHLRGLSYEKIILNVNESLVLRQFCRIYFNPIPHKSTLIRWSNQISQSTLEEFNRRLNKIAIQLQVTKGKGLSVKNGAGLFRVTLTTNRLINWL